MRILTDITEKQLQALDALAREKNVSRAALIRHAVDDLLAKRNRDRQSNAFGLWGNRNIDGLAYQEKLRSEW